MASRVAQPGTETYVDLGHDSGIEALQVILAGKQSAPVAYDEAAATARELMSFFEAFEQEGADDA